MSVLLDNQNRVSPGSYFPQLGGGGGGPVVTASNVNVSTIGGDGPGGTLNIVAGGGVFVTADVAFEAGGSISFLNNDGAITGVSTINGASYPPAGGAAAISTLTTSGGYVGDNQVAPLNGVPLNVVNGKWYQASLEITDLTFVTPPGPTDTFVISIEDATNQTNLGTYNMAQVSTNRGALGECGFSASGPFESLSTNAYFTFKSNTGAASTFVVTGGTGWLQPLN